MRPLRFTIFVATTMGLLVVAVYLWAPLIVANLPNTKLARPTVASNSVQSIEAGLRTFRPPPLRPVRTEHPHRPQPSGFDGGPALKVVRLVRPAVSLAPKTVQLPVAASGVSAPTISPGARLEHPASPAPTPALPTRPSNSQPRQPAPPSLPKPAPAGKPQPVPRTTAPSVAQPYPQPPPPAAAQPESPAAPVTPGLQLETQPSFGNETTETGGQTPAPPTQRVWLGYADTLPSRGSGLPSIWKGSSGVIFIGCGVNPSEDGSAVADTCPQESTGPTGDFYDAGAIRIDNTSATSSLVVTEPASVTIGTCVYAPWPGLKRTIPPGGTLILTQTGLSGDPCGQDLGGNYNLDTSESSGNGNCTHSSAVPEITLTIAGLATTIDDTAQILNTHGIDPGGCSGQNENEFEDWTLVP